MESLGIYVHEERKKKAVLHEGKTETTYVLQSFGQPSSSPRAGIAIKVTHERLKGLSLYSPLLLS